MKCFPLLTSPTESVYTAPASFSLGAIFLWDPNWKRGLCKGRSLLRFRNARRDRRAMLHTDTHLQAFEDLLSFLKQVLSPTPPFFPLPFTACQSAPPLNFYSNAESHIRGSHCCACSRGQHSALQLTWEALMRQGLNLLCRRRKRPFLGWKRRHIQTCAPGWDPRTLYFYNRQGYCL